MHRQGWFQSSDGWWACGGRPDHTGWWETHGGSGWHSPETPVGTCMGARWNISKYQHVGSFKSNGTGCREWASSPNKAISPSQGEQPQEVTMTPSADIYRVPTTCQALLPGSAHRWTYFIRLWHFYDSHLQARKSRL